MLVTSNSWGITIKRSSLPALMDILDFGMPKQSIRESQTKTSTSTSSQKRKFTFNHKIKVLHTSTGSKYKMTIGLFRMLWELCGNTIQIATKEIWSWRSTQANLMILLCHLSTIVSFQLVMMEPSGFGIMEIERSSIIENLQLKVKLHASIGFLSRRETTEEYWLQVSLTVLFDLLVFKIRNLH